LQASGTAADGGAAPELVPDVLHPKHVAAAEQALDRKDAAADAADPGKLRALDAAAEAGHGGSSGEAEQYLNRDTDAEFADFQPAAWHGQRHNTNQDAAAQQGPNSQHVADQVQPSQHLEEQRAQQEAQLDGQLRLEALRAADAAAESHTESRPGGAAPVASAGHGSGQGALQEDHTADHTASQRRLAAEQAAGSGSGGAPGSGKDGYAVRQRHLAARHDARYKHHLHVTAAAPPPRPGVQRQVGKEDASQLGGRSALHGAVVAHGRQMGNAATVGVSVCSGCSCWTRQVLQRTAPAAAAHYHVR